jgi:hypothetical protein
MPQRATSMSILLRADDNSDRCRSSGHIAPRALTGVPSNAPSSGARNGLALRVRL